MCCYDYTLCDLAITQCELLISCCTTYIIHDMMWSLFISCNHNSCCVIIVHSFWSPDVTKQGALQLLNNPLLPMIQELFTNQRHCIRHKISEMVTLRRKGKEKHSPSPGSMRVGTIPPSTTLIILSVCLSVCMCIVSKFSNSCFCITLFTWFSN